MGKKDKKVASSKKTASFVENLAPPSGETENSVEPYFASLRHRLNVSFVH